MMDATYSEFATFPSAQGDPYRSVKAEVSTLSEEVMGKLWIEVDSEFTLADGRGISRLTTYVSAPHKEATEEIDASQADADFFKAKVDEWHAALTEALNEARALVASAA